ncbi:MAG TPA: hypothetical protein VF615_00420 [Longimicrobiaceae bacterium]|jgi:hypothetical protein
MLSRPVAVPSVTASGQCSSAARRPVIDHPAFGRLPLVDFVRLQEIHTQHHRAQLPSGAA